MANETRMPLRRQRRFGVEGKMAETSNDCFAIWIFVVHSSFAIFSRICLKFVRHEIDYQSHARSIALQDRRRGEHVFPAI